MIRKGDLLLCQKSDDIDLTPGFVYVAAHDTETDIIQLVGNDSDVPARYPVTYFEIVATDD